MANEINISAVQGLTVTVELYLDGVLVGSPISATEIGSTGEYMASMPSVAYGTYLLVAIAGSNKIASGQIFWDGAYELNQSVAMLRGLDPNNPANQTTSELTAGDITIEVTGDPSSSVTFTRQP